MTAGLGSSNVKCVKSELLLMLKSYWDLYAAWLGDLKEYSVGKYRQQHYNNSVTLKECDRAAKYSDDQTLE